MMHKKSWMILFAFLLVAILTTVSYANWTYTVRRGDTLDSISRRVGVSLAQLRSWNGLWSNHLRVGQRITIPTQTSTASNRSCRSWSRALQWESGSGRGDLKPG